MIMALILLGALAVFIAVAVALSETGFRRHLD